MGGNASRWRSRGVRIIRADQLDDNTPQTLGMFRRAAVTTQLTGANRLWPGPSPSTPRRKPDRITTATSRASSTW